MPTVFESISDGFYTAFFETNPTIRKEKIEQWIKDVTPVVQAEVETDLRAYLEPILEGTWDEKGWMTRAAKFYGQSVQMGKREQLDFIDAYKLALDVTIRRRSQQKDVVIDPLTPEVREKTLDAIDKAKRVINPPPPEAVREINLHENHTVEEALPLVKEFLDECYQNNVKRVRIIHGKGIGVLRKAVRDYLEIHRFVVPKSIVSAEKDFGGEGATEANLITFSEFNQ